MTTSEFSGNLVLDWKHNDESHHQFLLASQNYGTMYGIYGKFHLEQENDRKYISKLELVLINYKGIINIGLCLNDKGKVGIHMKNLNKSTLQIKLQVQGLNNTHEAEADLAPYEKDRIDVTEIERIIIKRELHPLSSNSGSTIEETIFDNEFYYRDGIDTINDHKRKLRRGMKDYVEKEKSASEKDFLIGTNCHTSHLKVYNKNN